MKQKFLFTNPITKTLKVERSASKCFLNNKYAYIFSFHFITDLLNQQ